MCLCFNEHDYKRPYQGLCHALLYAEVLPCQIQYLAPAVILGILHKNLETKLTILAAKEPKICLLVHALAPIQRRFES